MTKAQEAVQVSWGRQPSVPVFFHGSMCYINMQLRLPGPDSQSRPITTLTPRSNLTSALAGGCKQRVKYSGGMYSITRLQVQVVSVFSHQDLFGPAQNWMFSARRLCPHPEYKNYRKLVSFVFCRINKKQNFNYFVCVPLMQPDLLKYEKKCYTCKLFFQR